MRRAHLSDNYGSAGGYSTQQTNDHLEQQNEQLQDDLHDKVRALKSLSIDIGHEVRDQNKFLNQMDSDFDSSGGFLGATMKRVQMMAKAGHNRYIFYLILFCLFVFFVLWIILKTR